MIEAYEWPEQEFVFSAIHKDKKVETVSSLEVTYL